MNTILLTGGTGLIGKDTLKVLLENGYSVVSLSRSKSGLSDSNLREIYFDACSDDLLNSKSEIGQFDAIVHLAAIFMPAETTEDRQQYQKINYQFTTQLLQLASEQLNDVKFILASSFSFLSKPLEQKITEDHPVAPGTVYSESKYWGEQQLKHYQLNSNFQTIALRISSPISDLLSSLHQNVVKIWITSALEGKDIIVHGAGSRKQDFVATIDIAHAIQKVLESSKASGVYNIGSGTTLSMADLAHTIGSRFKVSVYFSGEDLNEHEDWNIAIDKAKKDLNYRPEYSSEKIINQLIDTILESSHYK